MCHDHPVGIVEGEVPALRQCPQRIPDIVVAGVQGPGKLRGRRGHAGMGERLVDREPHILGVHHAEAPHFTVTAKFSS